MLDHFNAEAVRRYLNRMSDAMRPVVGNLHDRIRSFFTDSFELEGSNWCKDIREEFQKRRGYDLYTYYPLILKKVGPYGNEIKTPYGARIEPDVMERIYRMRYDYELTLAELFKERFLDELNAWCRACGVKSRIQAYGKAVCPSSRSWTSTFPNARRGTTRRTARSSPTTRCRDTATRWSTSSSLRARISRARTSSAARRSPTRASSSTRRSNASRSRVT